MLTNCNEDDEYRVPTRFRRSIQKQSWYTLRYVRVRNFPTSKILEDGVIAAENFNVLRRLKDDKNNNELWDRESHFGLIQSKATMWIQMPADRNDANSNTSNTHSPSIAVLLLDPSIIEGNPVWSKTRNWTQPPELGFNPKYQGGIPEDNSFENFVHWAKQPEAFNSLSTDNVSESSWLPTQMILHIICDQWLTLVDYLKTRLNQIEWEITYPNDLALADSDLARAERHNKLVTWHHMLPTFHEMIQDMASLQDTAHKILNERCACQSECSLGIKSKGGSRECRCCMYGWKNPYQSDISKLCVHMSECGAQVDRLMKLNTIDGFVNDNRARPDISRQTNSILWLTIIWILGPVLAQVLTVTTQPISELFPSLKLWAAVAIPFMSALVVGLRFYTA